MSAQRGEAGIEAIGKLSQNWDSYGAPPITEAALKVGREVIKMLRESEPFVTPCSNGGIQLEWHERGIDLEFTFGPDGEQEFE